MHINMWLAYSLAQSQLDLTSSLLAYTMHGPKSYSGGQDAAVLLRWAEFLIVWPQAASR